MPFIKTNDGCKLYYIDTYGDGDVLLMIPGWSQTAAMFKHQIKSFGNNYRVIAVDLRGHGNSEKVGYGYRISRISKDIYDLIKHLNLNDVVLIGWSMGCSVVWSYWDLFGSEFLKKIVLIDEYPFILLSTENLSIKNGCFGDSLDCSGLEVVYNELRGEGAVEFTKYFVKKMMSDQVDERTLDWVIQENLKFDRKYAADLILNHILCDWRDVLPRIDIPTLIFGAKNSIIRWESQKIIADKIKNSQLEIFEDHERGAHYIFLENPKKFNRILANFMGSQYC